MSLKQRLNNILSKIISYPIRYQYQDLISKGYLIIGKHTYGKPYIRLQRGSEAKVIIGNYCSIAKEVVILPGGVHPVDWVSTFPFRIKFGLTGAYEDGMPMTKGDITIGSDVWVGTGSTILSGVNIGHGAVVAAGSVVTKDVAPYAIVGGVPAKEISKRFDSDTISKMLGIAWWDWEEDEIKEAIPLLSSNDMEGFMQRYYEQAR